MPTQKDRRAKKSSNYEYVYSSFQRPPFFVDEYVNNPPMITKLNEEKEMAHAYASSLEVKLEAYGRLEIEKKAIDMRLENAQQTIEELKENLRLAKLELVEAQRKVEDLQEGKHDTNLELTRLKERLEEASRNSLVQFIISSLSTVLLAIGVNIITTTPNDWKGITLVISGIVLGAVAFFISRKNK